MLYEIYVDTNKVKSAIVMTKTNFIVNYDWPDIRPRKTLNKIYNWIIFCTLYLLCLWTDIDKFYNHKKTNVLKNLYSSGPFETENLLSLLITSNLQILGGDYSFFTSVWCAWVILTSDYLKA